MLKNEEVKQIADLARLEFSDDELPEIANKLSNVLNLIEQLQEVNTDNVEETSQITGLTSVLREDESKQWDKKEIKNALNQAPGLDEGEIKVKKVL